jgi:shikimate kinase
MGTGKTAVGRELAKRKKWQFLDLDDLIELRQKMTIAEIFTKNGEPYFRRIEKKVLKEASKERKFVYACGGGIVIDKENIKVMKETGIIICLTATPEAILKRTSGYKHRPLLNVDTPKKQIELLLKLRAPYYAQADKTIDTSKLSVKEVTAKIIKLTLRSKKRKTGFMFIELLLVLAIIMFLAFKVLKLYFKGPSLNKETQGVISEQGIDTTSSKSIIDSTRNKLEDIQNQHIDELNKIK